jgi:hypothetical protein
MREIPVQDWVDALESGKYTQGNGFLNKDGTHCCLGVLCDIIDNTRWIPKNLETHPDSIINNWGLNTSLLPTAISFQCKENSQNYSIDNDLMRMNDSMKYSFKEIAQYIMENIKSITYTEIV